MATSSITLSRLRTITARCTSRENCLGIFFSSSRNTIPHSATSFRGSDPAMISKSFCNQPPQPPATERRIARLVFPAIAALFACLPALAGDAPAWMHAQANVTLPTYDEKTDAVLLYSETNVTVVATDKIKTTVREAYKILRPNGREHGTVFVYYNPNRKIKSLHGWCVPAHGK